MLFDLQKASLINNDSLNLTFQRTPMLNLKDKNGISSIQKDMRIICEDIGNRLAGSPREEDAASYMAHRFEGMGLSNIETRVKTEEGVFVLESTPGKGTSALIKMIDSF